MPHPFREACDHSHRNSMESVVHQARYAARGPGTATAKGADVVIIQDWCATATACSGQPLPAPTARSPYNR